MLSEVYLSMHDFEKSVESGKKATQLNPNDPRVISVYGESLLRLKEYDEGLSYLEKAYELDPIPQGQTTSDRRVSALFLGNYLKCNFDKCQELNKKIVDIDLRTWLLNTDLFKKNDKDYGEESWFKKGLRNFSDSDWDMEVDRFHLNDDELKSNLISLAKRI